MKRVGIYILNFLLSLLFHWYWSIPAIILLICHFVFGISIWWFVAAFLLFVIIVRLYVRFISALIRAGNDKEPVTKNKNPYSVKNRERSNHDIR